MKISFALSSIATSACAFPSILIVAIPPSTITPKNATSKCVWASRRMISAMWNAYTWTTNHTGGHSGLRPWESRFIIKALCVWCGGGIVYEFSLIPQRGLIGLLPFHKSGHASQQCATFAGLSLPDGGAGLRRSTSTSEKGCAVQIGARPWWGIALIRPRNLHATRSIYAGAMSDQCVCGGISGDGRANSLIYIIRFFCMYIYLLSILYSTYSIYIYF